MSNLRQTPLTCSGHTRPVVHLDFSDITECGYFLISACKDGKPMLRQGDTGDWIGTFQGHKGAVWGVALNSQATRAATGAADFTGKVWDAITGNEVQSFQHKHIVKSVTFSSDSKLLATGSNEKLIRIFDLNQPDNEAQVFTGHNGGIKRALFCRGDSCIVSCADDKTMRLWDRTLCKEIHRVDFPAAPSSLELSKDGSILTATHGDTVSFWDASSFQRLCEAKVPTTAASASLHPDKSIFVCGGDDLKVYKFDYATGNEIESFKGHFGPIHTVQFSPDGELYASGSEDGTLRLWQTTVGKTYGLWKCIESNSDNSNHNSTSQKEIVAN
ncbi:serine-threonine kinase receptor-associated protein [Ctenocephalides felis]|uniref:serine-threonine kinase receptor-associated protein n=1 Tax=Ctenocephalides felis TaxID=7515 RepID=UPI000E6E262A|nr:serine-threonine kinase receptor-associated protein [Ctenocephalides felis]